MFKATGCVFVSIMQEYDQELFKLALPCLSAVAGALPPDYMESNSMDMIEKEPCVDSERNFTPRPADTARYAALFTDWSLATFTCAFFFLQFVLNRSDEKFQLHC